MVRKLLALLGVYLPVAASAAADPECLAVEGAFAHNDLTHLESLELEDRQWQILKQFRLAAIYIPADERRLARTAIRNGLNMVRQALRENPHDPEILLLGAMLDGQYLLLNPWRFLHNGRRGLARLRQAETRDPSNPRVALIRGTAEVLLPRVFGGNPGGARTRFAEALAAPGQDNVPFAESKLCVSRAWAQVDLLNWLGRANTLIGDHNAAEAAYRKALQRSPNNHWVQLALDGAGYVWTDT